ALPALDGAVPQGRHAERRVPAAARPAARGPRDPRSLVHVRAAAAGAGVGRRERARRARQARAHAHARRPRRGARPAPRGRSPMTVATAEAVTIAAGQNPLRDPSDQRLTRIPGPNAMTFFGVTGDLARKKLLP